MRILLQQAMGTVHQGLRPHTRAQYNRQFKLFLSFVLFHKCTQLDAQSTVLCFLQFLAGNNLSFRIISNYISAMKHFFMRYKWNERVFEDVLVKRLLRGIQYSSVQKPRPKGLFSLRNIKEISQLCHSYESTLTYRAAFLLAFYGLFRISNLAPTNSCFFDSRRHLLRSDVRFSYPGVHIRVKWAKNIQAPERQHWVKLPVVQDSVMCPVKTLATLLQKFWFKFSQPLLVLDDYQLLTQSHLRSCLAILLRNMGLPLEGHRFHTFRRSAATIAYDANASLTAIKTHGLWHSDAIWSYISDNMSHALQVPLTFQRLINNPQ